MNSTLQNYINTTSVNTTVTTLVENVTGTEMVCNQWKGYAYYHQHPINKALHTITIPFIVITLLNITQLIKTEYWFHYKKKRCLCKWLDLSRVFYGFLGYYLLYYGIWATIWLTAYLWLCDTIGIYWRQYRDTTWLQESFLISAIAWALQFTGHMIEGRVPALFTSLRLSILEAPVYNVNTIVTIL